MAAVNPTLFSWDHFEETTPELKRFELAKQYLPDEEIMKALREIRGKGSNDYPVEAMWNALLAGVVFQHESVASLLRELKRNPALLQACGFNPVPVGGKLIPQIQRDTTTGKTTVIWSTTPLRHVIPDEHNFSRFLANVIQLEEDRQLVSGLVDRLREGLMAVLPDYGQHLGYDGKAIASHSTGHNSADGETSDADADWGKHETTGIDARTGKAWTKVKSWFGYGLHLIADSHYELPVAFRVTPASHSIKERQSPFETHYKTTALVLLLSSAGPL